MLTGENYVTNKACIIKVTFTVKPAIEFYPRFLLKPNKTTANRVADSYCLRRRAGSLQLFLPLIVFRLVFAPTKRPLLPFYNCVFSVLGF